MYYILEKCNKNVILMDMKKLSEYKDQEEVMKEIQKKFPVLTYQVENDNFYTMLYYGKLPDPFGEYVFSSEFIRIYYTNETYHYVACIGGREPEDSIVCNDKTVEEVIEMFKVDIEKSKKSVTNRRIREINKDF